MIPGSLRAAWCLLLVVCADGLPGTLVRAGEKPVTDAALLEFLGSVDSNVPGWQKYRDDAQADRSGPRGSTVPVRSTRPADPPSPPDPPPREVQP